MNTLINDLTNTILKFIKASDAVLLGLDISDCQPYLELVNRKDRKRLARQQNNVCWINQCVNHNKPQGLISTYKAVVKKLFCIGCSGDVRGFRKYTSYQMYQLISFIEGLACGQQVELFEKFITRIPIDMLINKSLHFTNANMRIWLLLGFDDEDYIITKMNEWKIQLNPDILGIICYKNRLRVLEYSLEYCNNDINNVGSYVIGYLYECNKLSLLDNFTGQLKEKDLEPVVIRFCLGSDIEALEYISRFTNKHTLCSCLSLINSSLEIDKYRTKIFKECGSSFWSNQILYYRHYSIDTYCNYRIMELLKPFICRKKWFDGTPTMLRRKHEFNKPTIIITELIHDYIRNNKMDSLKELCIKLITNDQLQILKEILLNNDDIFKQSTFMLSLFSYLKMTPKQLRMKYRHDTGLKHPPGMKRLQLLVKFIELLF